jgi:hypothetical protein
MFESSRDQISGNSLVYISEPQNIPTIILLIGMIGITLLFVAFKQRFTLLLTSLFSQRHLSQLLREGKSANKNLFIWVHVIIFVVESLFLFLILDYYFPKLFHFLNPFLLYGLIILVTVVDFLLKKLFSFLYFNMFDYMDEFSQYVLYKLLFHFTNTIGFLIIIPLSLYSGSWKLILLSIPFLTITFSITYLKIFTINLKKIKLFQFFIYFCTLEILPYLMVIKMLIQLNK